MLKQEMISDYTHYKILKDIYMLINEKEISLKDLAIKINIDRGHPYLYEVLRELMDKKIVIHTKTIGNAKFIRINKSELKDYIYDCDFFNTEFVDFVAKANPLGYNI